MDHFDELVNMPSLLGVAILLGFLQLAWAAVAARQQQGFKWAAGPRDEERVVTGMAARLERAYRNYMETFPLFAAALILGSFFDQAGDKTLFLRQWGAVIYVAARIVYVPLYAWGVAGWRSVVWAISVVGLLMVTAALFMPAIQAPAA
jgi:uncharacterized MAPEG superfamily protein